MSDYYSAADFSTGARQDKPREQTGSGALTGDYWDSRQGGSGTGSTGSSGSTGGSSYKRPEGVAVSRVPMPGGVYGSQRLGFNPDAWERFPYGVRYTSATAGTASWTDLTPAYRSYIDSLAKHPNIGSSTSTGRMLWERMNTLSADRLSQGENISAQMLIAELAGSVGISPDLGYAAEQFDGMASGSGSYGGSYGGGYGYGGGGGGSSSVALTDPTSARGLLLQTMQGVLGRNPTDREYRDFLKTLNKSEMANPRTVEMDGDVAVQSGGIDASVLALDFAKAADDYKATQANKFYNAFMGALGGGVSG